jgi:hypothetical protein
MACRALRLVNFCTSPEGAIGVANLNSPDFLDAQVSCLFDVDSTCGRFVVRRYIENQANDDEHGDDERGQTQQKHLLRGFDGTRVGFVLIVAVDAHEILCWGVTTRANV